MANRGFRIGSALGLLLVYLFVMVVSNVSLLVCDCHHHHHTAHSAHNEHYSCLCGSCHSHDVNSVAVDAKCGCTHNHSNTIDLYTFSRDWDNNDSVRLMLQPLFVADSQSCADVESFVTRQEYGAYLLLPLSAAKKGCVALRAPPVLV